jgi:hypothetical protein
LRNSTSRIVRGVDTRGDGDYFIHWPSAGLPILCDARLAEWPSWLLGKLLHKAEAQQVSCSVGPHTLSDGRLAGLVKLVAGAREGERNSLLFWAACRARESGRKDEFTAECLALAAAHAGLPFAEARRTVRSALDAQ